MSLSTIQKYWVWHESALMANLCRRQHNVLRSTRKVPTIFCSTLNQIRSFKTDHKNLYYKITRKNVQWKQRWYMWRETRKNMTKLIGTFCDYANTPKNFLSVSPPQSWSCKFTAMLTSGAPTAELGKHLLLEDGVLEKLTLPDKGNLPTFMYSNGPPSRSTEPTTALFSCPHCTRSKKYFNVILTSTPAIMGFF